MRTAPPRCSAGRMQTAGAPSERVSPAIRRGYSLALKTTAARSGGLAGTAGTADAGSRDGPSTPVDPEGPSASASGWRRRAPRPERSPGCS